MEKTIVENNQLKGAQKLVAEALHALHHYLPAQAPLKDFVHHNTLHAFQDEEFFDAVCKARRILGYKTLKSLSEYRKMYEEGRISKEALLVSISERTGIPGSEVNLIRHLRGGEFVEHLPLVGSIRSLWKKHFQIDLDALVHPVLFRMLCNFLDQGIAHQRFPYPDDTFLEAIRKLERNGWVSIFEDRQTRQEFISGDFTHDQLLAKLVGNTELIIPYLFDQQFAHQGWSGMIATIERQPESLLDARKISLGELIYLELFLELDRLRHFRKSKWRPLGNYVSHVPDYFNIRPEDDSYHLLLSDFHVAFERTYYDQVARALQLNNLQQARPDSPRFQAFFCIDDRECSFRRYLEELEPQCETFGTPGFFGVDAFFRPAGGKFVTKICPVPVKPKHLILETGIPRKVKKDIHLSRMTHSGLASWLSTYFLGFWAGLKLFFQFFKPGGHAAGVDSFQHMQPNEELDIEYRGETDDKTGLQIGYHDEEMANRVENVLRSTGLVKNFAPLVYFIGHGASSVNNPHFAAYDCGACCGRPGSVNARTMAKMANRKQVREILALRGLIIPAGTVFIGALHDTTRDEVVFYDEQLKSDEKYREHLFIVNLFMEAGMKNARERSRRFVNTDTTAPDREVYRKVRARAFSLFEPRPELNHATNAVCIVGRRDLSRGVFLDRRSFLNSYDAGSDPEGKYLDPILNAATPVCGGINLEYFFSATDPQRMGADTKLPYNVMGLIGVANGVEGDLRPGLPSQMTEVHDPLRLLMVVEHNPEVVMNFLRRNPSTREWYDKGWVHLLLISPGSKALFIYKSGEFLPYHPLQNQIPVTYDVQSVIESTLENIPVMIIKKREKR